MAGENSYKYKVAENPTMPEAGQVCVNGYMNWDGSSDITAQNGKKIVVVEVDSLNRCVALGFTTVVAKE